MENKNELHKESWVKFNPTNMPELDYYVTKIIQDSEGTKFILKDSKNNVEIFFDGFIPMLTVSDEGIRMRTWMKIESEQPENFFFRHWFLYKVENSKLLKWVEKESFGVYEEGLIHFIIATSDDVIDILSYFEPKITISEISEL
jgi:hypothetical protein